MNRDPQDVPPQSEFIEDEFAPLPPWLTTPASPLRVRDLRTAMPTYRLVCVEHPAWATSGCRSWVVRYAEAHALEAHGVALPPQSAPFETPSQANARREAARDDDWDQYGQR